MYCFLSPTLLGSSATEKFKCVRPSVQKKKSLNQVKAASLIMKPLNTPVDIASELVALTRYR